jgi:hypothetical protein
MFKFLKLMFWRLRYCAYDRDARRPLLDGKGTRENPLTMEDMQPVMKMIARLKPPH